MNIGKIHIGINSSAAAGSEILFSDLDVVAKLMSSCPLLGVSMGGVNVICMLDTGSMVSTVTQIFSHQHFEFGVKKSFILGDGFSSP